MTRETPAEWLSKLPPWDGTPRLAHWLTTYLGTDDTPYTRLVGRLLIIGMIARALRPGSKFDYCIVLEGPQGIGKSEALRILGGEWFSDSDFDIGNRDAVSAIQGKWLYEFAEMGSVTRAESTKQKSFLSRQFDEFRPLYGKNSVRLARQCVFIGTTHESKWRMDQPIARFFLPVHCQQINLAALQADREQLFAEALAAYTVYPDILSDLIVEYTPDTTERIDSACSGVAACPNCRLAINQHGSSKSATLSSEESNSGSLWYDESARSTQAESKDEARSRENTSNSSDSISTTSGGNPHSTPRAS